MSSQTFDITKSIYITSSQDVDAKYRITSIEERDALITNRVIQRHHIIAFDSDSEVGFPRGRYQLVDYPIMGSLTGVVWSIVSESGRLDQEIADRIDGDNNIIGQLSFKADLVNGVVPYSQLPDGVKIEVISATENTLQDFITNNGNYEFQEGDLIEIINSYNLRYLYFFKSGDKSVTTNYLQISSETGVFRTELVGTTVTQVKVGGISESTTVSELEGKTVNNILELILFPEIEATVQSLNTLTLNPLGQIEAEVGETVNVNLAGTYNTGVILDGDESTLLELTGDPRDFRIAREETPSTTLYTDVAVGNSVSYTFNSLINEGDNKWIVSLDYLQGTSVYKSNRGTVGTNLSSETSAGTISEVTASIVGKYKWFYHKGDINTSPTTSTDIRSLSDYGLINNESTESINIPIPANTQELSIYVPQNKIIKLIDLTNFNLDLTSLIMTTSVTVNDAGSNPINYNKHTYVFGGNGYLSNADLTLSIT